MAIYTSSYETVLNRNKDEKDIYIQVSRDLGQYAQPDDTTGLKNLIDEDWGEEFGNWWGNKFEYKNGISKKDLRKFASYLRAKEKESALYLLCFENVLVGEVCHRRWLAELLGKGFGLSIEEWESN